MAMNDSLPLLPSLPSIARPGRPGRWRLPAALSSVLAVLALQAGAQLPQASAALTQAPGVPALAATPLPTIDLDDVKVGQRGYGLSVFAGGEPERFDVEVIGVMRNISPDMSYILARLSGRGLESSGVAAGMSGSPVFLDGRPP